MDLTKLYHHFLSSDGVSTDTRQTLKDKLFFALKGDHFDGNQFAKEAIEKGAKYAIVDDPELRDYPRFVVVENALTTLQKLAFYHRNHLNISILAITGSNGKTTTKELVANVLSKKHQIIFSHGNLNNHIGVPLTLLRMTQSTDIGIVEMGANHKGEIAELCEIARPDYGYITNFGKAHLEGFGGVEGVIKGKSELYDFLKAHDKKIFVDAGDDIQMRKSLGGQQIKFSASEAEDYTIKLRGAEPYVEVEYDGNIIKSHLLGDYNFKNISAAICIGKYFSVENDQIKQAIESYIPDNNRSQIINKGTNKIILDAYNANPTSMMLALENFETFSADKRIAILGDMFEIGENALLEHQVIVDFLEKHPIDKAYVCGEVFDQTKVKSVQKFKSFDMLMAVVSGINFQSSVILIKGSRGMAMERLIDFL